MASPQKENGYTPLANELTEAISRFPFSGAQARVLIALLRKTYGYQKSEDAVSIEQWRTLTNLSRRSIIYALQDLEAMHIILVRRVRDGERNLPNVYRIIKDYDQWIVQNSAPQVEKNRKQASLRSAKLRKSVKKTRVVQNSAKSSAKLGKEGCKTLSKTDGVLHPQKKKENTKENTKESGAPQADAPTPPIPREIAAAFFQGIELLMQKQSVPWLQDLLRSISEKNGVSKQAIWDEVRNFGMFWTELNPTGAKQRWQLQKTFMVERRLETWFRRAGFKQFSANVPRQGRAKGIIGLTK